MLYLNPEKEKFWFMLNGFIELENKIKSCLLIQVLFNLGIVDLVVLQLEPVYILVVPKARIQSDPILPI